jgi:NADPH:quinone reductase-like Zn-dependent oxidoreductase
LAQVSRPSIGDGEVLVRVHAASVDRGTWHIMTGLPYPIRVAGFGLRRPKYLNPGRSLAGTAEAVGSDVTGFSPGDEVYGIGDGSSAQYIAVGTEKLAPKPVSLSFVSAAAVPISALTALQAVRDHGRVQAGDKVLVVGASGGVGTFAVQIARASAAEVKGVCSTTKVERVRSIGADHVVDYMLEDFASGRKRYDVILDIGGTASWSRLRDALAPNGTLVIVGGETAGRWLGGADRQIRAVVLSRFVNQKLGTFICSENAGDRADLSELIESGKLTPVIDRTYSLSEVPAAIQRIQDGQGHGKIIVAIEPPPIGRT